MPNTISTTRIPSIVYYDLNSLYTIAPNSPLQLSDVQATQNLIINVCFTAKGEMPFEPEFGSGIPQLLFDAVSDRNALYVLHEAYTSISTWIPWVNVDRQNSSVIADPNNGVYQFNLYYTIANLPTAFSTNLTINTFS